MKTKTLGFLSFICLILTSVWIILLVWINANEGELETFDDVLLYVTELDVSFYATYVNAALITLVATMLFASLYIYCKPSAPMWSMIGLVFVPVYCCLNLFAYLSQITVVPELLDSQKVPEYQNESTLLLHHLLQLWPESTVAFLNALAYAILAIPSIIYGVILYNDSRFVQIAGVLLALSGVASIVGMVGIATRNDLIGTALIVGGALFLLALIPFSVAFLKSSETVVT